MGLNAGGGAAAGPHATSHENGGTDEIDATGLDGVTGGPGGGGDTTDRTRAEIRDDCFYTATTVFAGGLAGVVSGTSANLSADVPEVAHPGITILGTGSTSTGRAAISGGQAMWIDTGAGGPFTFGCVVHPWNLSDGTNRYTLVMGVANSSTSLNPNDGIYFRYADNVNSGKWEAVCRFGATETAVDTGITADTSWHTFAFVVNATGTSVGFYIDDVLVATITTNIPVGTDLRLVPIAVFKSLGGTARFFSIDAYWYVYEL